MCYRFILLLLWYKGCIPLRDIGGMFDKEVLSQLKSENGGLQTVLRNCADVFCGKFIICEGTNCNCSNEFREAVHT